MKFYEALRLTTEEGAWIAVVPQGNEWRSARQAMRWDKQAKAWAIAFWFGDGPWRIADMALETMPVRLGERAIDSEWEKVETALGA